MRRLRTPSWDMEEANFNSTKTGEPSRGNVGVFRLDKNRERVFNHDWFALVPPTPEEIREAHLAQNPPPTTRLREPRPLPEPPKRG